jgi:glycosyltransferase involved in cell wall biosynthesis
MFLFASRTDTFGQVLLEAMASGLPVIAVDEGGPRSIVRHGRTGLLRAPEAQDLAAAVLALSESPSQRARLAQAALADVRRRTWEASLARLADGYRAVLADRREVRRAA